MEIGQSFLPNYYFLQNYLTDPEYYVNFAKIRDSRTTFIESSLRNLRINHGVYIDVFPLDYYPEHNAKIFRTKDLLFSARIKSEYDASFSAKMIALQEFSKLLYHDVNNAVRRRDELMQSVLSSSLLANICGVWGSREIAPVGWFGDGTDAVFEDIVVQVPANFHKYLTKLYGEYMTPPPIEKRIGHHYTELIDLNKPYTEYIK